MTELTLSADTIKLLDTTQLTDNHVMIVNVDVGSLPPIKAQEHLDRIKDALRAVIPESTKLIILPKGKIDIQIIETQDEDVI